MTYEFILVGLIFEDGFGNPVVYLSHYAIFILFFYIHSDIILPLIARNFSHVVLIAPLLLIMECSLYVFCQYADTYILFLLGIQKKMFALNHLLIWRNVYRAILYMGFATGYYFLKTYLAERKRTEALERQRLHAIIKAQQMEQDLTHAQNAFLKAQISPHFLFNTLDFVYHNVNQHSEIAGETIIKLSEMMRFAMESNVANSQIRLIDEILQVKNLIALHQLRKDHQIPIEFSYDDKVLDLLLIPLILLTLVENMFKHGNLSQSSSPACIRLDLKGDFLYIYTANLINHEVNLKGNNSGLKNIKQRLDHAYGNHALCFYRKTENNHFEVKIEIPIKLFSLPA